MIYKSLYKTPDGFTDILLQSDGEYLTGLWFEKGRDYPKHIDEGEFARLPVFDETKKWLDIYFEGRNPDFTPKFRIVNSTPFRNEVIREMLKIPFGKTVTYGDIAKKVAANHGLDRMSRQAVGGAVGWNPVCIIVPCHRVVAGNSSLTGYGGGIENKIALLKNEGHDMSEFRIPTKGTALHYDR